MLYEVWIHNSVKKRYVKVNPEIQVVIGIYIYIYIYIYI